MRMHFGTLLLLASFTVSPAIAASKCPADPFKASTALWNWGDLLRDGRSQDRDASVWPENHLQWR